MEQSIYYPIQGIEVHSRDFNSEYSFPLHSQPLHQFYAVLEGVIEHRVANTIHHLKKAESLFIAPGIVRSPRAASAKGTYLVVGFHGPWLQLGEGDGEKVHLDKMAYEDLCLLREISKEKRRSHVLSILFHRICLRLLGVREFAKFEQARSTSVVSAAEHEQTLLKRAEAVMQSNLTNRLQLEEIATLTGISRSTIDRLFRKAYKQSPCARYRELRLSRARDLLKAGGRSVTQIAIETGFASSQHFATQFKKRFKISPSSNFRTSR